jgi:hypothetical protein
MPILDANDPAFFEQYPNGATMYDAWGRRLRNVAAYNLETGEVVRFVPWKGGHPIVNLFRMLGTLHLLNPSRSLIRRHGFWPAPLRVVPKPAHTYTIIKI